MPANSSDVQPSSSPRFPAVTHCGPGQVDGRSCSYYADNRFVLVLHRSWSSTPRRGEPWAPLTCRGRDIAHNIRNLLVLPRSPSVETTIERLVQGLGAAVCERCGGAGWTKCSRSRCGAMHVCESCDSSGMSIVYVLGVPVQAGDLRAWATLVCGPCRASHSQGKLLVFAGESWTLVAMAARGGAQKLRVVTL